MNRNHKSAQYNSLIPPQSERAIEAIGHTLAYSAAALKKKKPLPQPVLDIYECPIICQDPAWYSEVGVSRMEQKLKETALISFMPHLPAYFEMLAIENYVQVPFVSDASWICGVVDSLQWSQRDRSAVYQP